MSSNSPTISVIIPTYNSSGTLRWSLETVLLQDFTDFEVWVIGDGCTDDTEKVVLSFDDDRVHWLNLPSNSGAPSLPRNEGLRRARGTFIAYLGHDDLWFPWHLSELMICIEKSISDFVYSLGALVGKHGVVSTYCTPKDPSPSNWMHRKELVERVGFWSTDIKFGHDVDFVKRVQSAGFELTFWRQISVLTFPAAWWRMYSLISDYPQSKYMEAMRSNPEALRLEILLDCATALSQSGDRSRLMQSQLKSFFPKPLRSMFRRIFDVYGRQRWPLVNYIHWRWRQRSGLDDKKNVL